MSGGPAGRGRRRDTEPQGPPAAAEDLARRLMEHEADGAGSAEALVDAGERVLRRLRGDLAPVLGSVGYSALEGRALDLARRQYAFLGPDRVVGSSLPRALEDVREVLAERDALEARDALRAVCAHLLGLLVTFLGEPLTTQFIRLAWPDLRGEGGGSDDRETP